MVVAAELSKLDDVLEYARENVMKLRDTDIETGEIFGVQFIVDEIFSNISKYGVVNGPVEVNFEITKNSCDNIVLKFEDNGISYNPLMAPEPDINAPIEEMQPGGWGIHLVKEASESMKYEYRNNKNILVIEVKRKQ